LGSRTVLSGSVSQGKNDPSQSLQMIERPLMTPDELKSIPKGNFVVMKTGTHPMQTRLKLYLDWGITFEEPYIVPERANRKVVYASRLELEQSILKRYPPLGTSANESTASASAQSGQTNATAADKQDGQRSHMKT
jgi:type IV secretion system protein VirD4